MKTREFTVTKNLFADYTGYTKPLSYAEWMDIPQSHKLAVLFCQFFSQITLAWSKNECAHITEQDGVETVLQYLNKNVKIIMNHRERFNAAYIYTVCYNCLNSLYVDVKRTRIYNHEHLLDITAEYEEDYLDMFSRETDFDAIDREEQKKLLWSVIESKGRDAVAVVSELTGHDLNWLIKSDPGKKKRKISKWDFKRISEERKAEILEEIKADLKELADQDKLYLLMS